ncbi:hypothetical protein ANN_11648 [Periplaneta americana]|uniref:Uncharacterized protein n=1 Tax=Periplaneta americana TaxID=6978 RepID=A0ABQ8T5N2_PERAM|nr:hypothetical protein ANN_11648 [Periplaneta americana]
MACLDEGGNEPAGSIKAICISLGDLGLRNEQAKVWGLPNQSSGPEISASVFLATYQYSMRGVSTTSGSSTESYPAFALLGLRENPGKNLNQVTCPDRESNPGHLVSRPDALTVTPQVWTKGGGKLAFLARIFSWNTNSSWTLSSVVDRRPPRCPATISSDEVDADNNVGPKNGKEEHR